MSVAYAETWAVPAAPPTPAPAAAPPPDVDAQLVGYEPAPRLGRRIAVINNKGGVGKTMITVEIASALGRRGRRVLVVDLDPQANATRRLAAAGELERQAQPQTLAEALHEPVDKGSALLVARRCGWSVPEAHLIDVLPSAFGLEDRVLEAGQPGAIRRLAKLLYEATDEYDYTLIDCPPSMGHLTQMALCALDGARDGVLIPVIPEWDSVDGAQRALTYVARFAELQDTAPATVLGVIVNGGRRTGLHQVRTEQLTQSLTNPADGSSPPILQPPIRLAAQIAEVHDAGEPAILNATLRASGLIDALDQLAAEVDA